MWTGYLRSEQIALFESMPSPEQRHALAVLHTLQDMGQVESALGQAALLHDVGKMEGSIRLWHRVLTVVLQSLAPGLLLQMARDEPSSWRYPFFVQLWHASRSADMATQVGADPLAVALIRWHHTRPEETNLDARGRALLVALRLADDQN